MDLLLPTTGFGLVTASILALAAVGFTVRFSVTGVVDSANSVRRPRRPRGNTSAR